MSFIPDNQTSGDSRVIVEKKLKEPDRYRVLLHNDDYTSMEFVAVSYTHLTLPTILRV